MGLRTSLMQTVAIIIFILCNKREANKLFRSSSKYSEQSIIIDTVLRHLTNKNVQSARTYKAGGYIVSALLLQKWPVIWIPFNCDVQFVAIAWIVLHCHVFQIGKILRW
jgi:hypothetical protein